MSGDNMENKEIAEKVFKGDGFLTNDSRTMGPYQWRSHISLINPVKVYEAVLENNFFYDRDMLMRLISKKIDIRKDEKFVFSEWTNNIIESEEQLVFFLETHPDFHYSGYNRRV